MLQYFNMLREKAELNDKQYKSVLQLTKDLMLSGDYYRREDTLLNGNKRMRTYYKKEFDNTLVAKWILYYRNLFISKLSKCDNLSEYYVSIINDVFDNCFRHFDYDKLLRDSTITSYVTLSLDSRIRQYMYFVGSNERLKQYNAGLKSSVRIKTAVNHMANSLDEMLEDGYDVCDNDDYEEKVFINDIENCLKGIPFGIKVLNTMLHSNKLFDTKNIDVELDIPIALCTEETKNNVLKAYNIIKKKLCDYCENTKRFKRITKVYYSFENVS